jgi:PAS domain-containing protein
LCPKALLHATTARSIETERMVSIGRPVMASASSSRAAARPDPARANERAIRRCAGCGHEGGDLCSCQMALLPTLAENAQPASGSRLVDCPHCQGIIDALPFYVLLVDENHTIISANHRVAETYGPNASCGAFCPRVIHGVEAFAGCPLEQAALERRPIETEFYDAASARWMASAVYPTDFQSAHGARVFLHFARDITEEKRVAAELSRSLEHHRALGQLLQRLNACTSAEECLDALLDVTLGLSWMGLGKRAMAFLMEAGTLRLVACKNVDPVAKTRCGRVPRGECVCGRVADTGRPLVQIGRAHV